MPEVRVKGRDGTEQVLEAAEGTQLMETLRDSGLGVDGTCGGACSCGTCHVYVSAEWSARLPAKSEDESMMLEALAEYVPLREGSRLSCQIRIEREVSGIVLEVAPAVD